MMHLCSHSGSRFVKLPVLTTDCLALRNAGLSKTCHYTISTAALQ